jgi:hypothetical protein
MPRSQGRLLVDMCDNPAATSGPSRSKQACRRLPFSSARVMRPMLGMRYRSIWSWQLWAVDGRRCGSACVSQYRSHRATVYAPVAASSAGPSRIA